MSLPGGDIRDIWDIRGTSEGVVKVQAASVYRILPPQESEWRTKDMTCVKIGLVPLRL